MEPKLALEKRQADIAAGADAIELTSLSDLIRLSELLSRSGYFADVKEASQAFVKVLYGRELGFGAITSMTGVHIIQNKPTLSANLIAAAIKRSKRYDFRIFNLSDDGCSLEFYENGQALTPRSTFYASDAERANLLSGRNGHTWRAYPRNMYFARALTNGARWHCSAIFGGAVYTPEEMGAEVDGEGAIVSIPATVQMPTPIAIGDAHLTPTGELISRIKELRNLGQSYKEIQDQMEYITGKRRRDELSLDEIELVEMEFDSLIAAIKVEAAEAEAHIETPVEEPAGERPKPPAYLDPGIYLQEAPKGKRKAKNEKESDDDRSNN